MGWDQVSIRNLRKQTYGETQAAFARRCGVDVRTIAAWEAGRPPVGSAQKLLDLLAGDQIAPKEAPKKNTHPREQARMEEWRSRLGRSR